MTYDDTNITEEEFWADRIIYDEEIELSREDLIRKWLAGIPVEIVS